MIKELDVVTLNREVQEPPLPKDGTNSAQPQGEIEAIALIERAKF